MLIKLSYKGQNKRIANLKKYENIMFIGFNLKNFQASSMPFAVTVAFVVKARGGDAKKVKDIERGHRES